MNPKQTLLTSYAHSIFHLLGLKSNFSQQKECGCLLDIHVLLSSTGTIHHRTRTSSTATPTVTCVSANAAAARHLPVKQRVLYLILLP